MRIMAIDYGDAHTGAAVSDLTGLLAGYTETIHTRRQEEALSRLGELIGEYGVEELVLGYPKHRDGALGPRGEEAEAKARAQALLNELSMGFLTGSMEIAGLPIVIPGRMVTLAKINEEFNRDYFLTKVVHHMDTEGYETAIHFAGNKV